MKDAMNVKYTTGELGIIFNTAVCSFGIIYKVTKTTSSIKEIL